VSAFSFGDFMAGRLQFAVSPLAGTVLAPVAPIAPFGGFEFNLGTTFTRLPRHDFIAVLVDPGKTRGLSVERKTDAVENSGLPRAGRPGNGENTA
jgi:hypothetical protein